MRSGVGRVLRVDPGSKVPSRKRTGFLVGLVRQAGVLRVKRQAPVLR